MEGARPIANCSVQLKKSEGQHNLVKDSRGSQREESLLLPGPLCCTVSLGQQTAMYVWGIIMFGIKTEYTV